MIGSHVAVKLVCYSSFEASHRFVVGASGCDQAAVVLAAAFSVVSHLL